MLDRFLDLRPKTIVIFGVIVVAIIFAIVFGTTSSYVKKNSSDRDRIAENVLLGDMEAAGMTAEEAKQAVDSFVASLQTEQITLQAGDKTAKVQAQDLGLYWANPDVIKEAVGYGSSGNIFARKKAIKTLKKEAKQFPVSLGIDEKKFKQVLKKQNSAVTLEAVNFGLKRENGQFSVTGGKEGWSIDASASFDTAKEYFADGWKKDPVIELTQKTIKPKGSAEELSTIKDELGKFSTEYGSSADGRKKNIANATGKISGSVVYPGDEFDVYKVCSPLTEDNGYAIAKSYANGTTVDDVGGGLCQVSTTLYNAVIRAELEVVERYGHSMIVNYVDPSMDAAIAGTDKNFRFKNNLKTPVYIEGHADGDYLSFSIYGQETRDPNREVTFESKVLDKEEPTTQFVASNAPVGSIELKQGSHTGYDAELIKIVKVNGVEKSREEFNHTSYMMSPTIYAVGVKSSNGDAVSAMYDAISTQSMSRIQAAASRWG